MDELLKEMQSKGLVTVVKSFKLKGKAKAVFDMIEVLGTTEPMVNLSMPMGTRRN